MKLERPRHRLLVSLACSLLLHLSLVALGLWARSWPPPVVVKRGEPLFVELPSERPEESVPRSAPTQTRPKVRPARPSTPAIAARPKPEAPKARPAPPVQAPRPAVPEPAPSPPAPEPTRAPEPSAVAKAAPSPEPERARPAPPPSTGETPEEKPGAPAPEAGDPLVSRALPRSEGFPGLPHGGVPGRDDRFRRGRGLIDGEPIPLDTSDPRYTDYFEKIRQQIKSYWIYPREAGERGIGGQLIIDFAIAKSGELEAVELRRPSGVHVLDLYALNAVKLAQPFPPVPDAVSRGVLPIRGIFTYQIVDTGLLNQFLR